MSTTESARSTSTTVLIAVLATLIGAEAVLVTSDLSDGVRYGVGAVLLVALIGTVVQLARQRR